MDWFSYKKKLKIKNEIETHPNTLGKKSNLFTSVSFESTEIEYLDFLYGLIRSRKPTCVLETGTNVGISTVALGFALKENSLQSEEEGHLYSIEKNPKLIKKAVNRVTACGLRKFVTIINSNSIDYLSQQGKNIKYDFVYFDSSRSDRPKEFSILKSRELFQTDSLLVFHDTCLSLIKSNKNEAYKHQEEYLKSVNEIAEFCHSKLSLDLSRGLTILRFICDKKQ